MLRCKLCLALLELDIPDAKKAKRYSHSPEEFASTLLPIDFTQSNAASNGRNNICLKYWDFLYRSDAYNATM